MSINSFSNLFVKITLLLLLAACRPELTEPDLRATPTTFDSTTHETDAPDIVDSLIDSLTDAGADVMNDGRFTGQDGGGRLGGI